MTEMEKALRFFELTRCFDLVTFRNQWTAFFNLLENKEGEIFHNVNEEIGYTPIFAWEVIYKGDGIFEFPRLEELAKKWGYKEIERLPYVVCPHCKHEHDFINEYFMIAKYEMECQECKQEFELKVHKEITFTTSII